MKDQAIYFFLTAINRPTGGHAVIIRHCQILSFSGFKAFIVFNERNKRSFYASEIPIELITSAEAAFSDPTGVYVFPETDLSIWIDRARPRLLSNSPCKTVILNQNHFYTHNMPDDPFARAIFYRSTHVCTSAAIYTYLKRYMGIKTIERITLSVDNSLFRPLTKKLQIAIMPRKMPLESKFIMRTFHNYCPIYNSIPWKLVDNMPHLDVAATLNETFFFISLQKNEGFGLPALEAMASGCLVIGFTGFGGGEYANVGNGIWVGEGDLLEIVESLTTACKNLISDRKYYNNTMDNARDTALEFSSAIEGRSVCDVWGRVQSELHPTQWGK